MVPPRGPLSGLSNGDLFVDSFKLFSFYFGLIHEEVWLIVFLETVGWGKRDHWGVKKVVSRFVNDFIDDCIDNVFLFVFQMLEAETLSSILLSEFSK